MILRTKLSKLFRNVHTWIKPDGYDTGISIYNNILNKSVPLVTNNKGLLTWYTCGPTVYDSAHIGHASCYVKLDIIQRILRNAFNINVVTVMNITDVDDKIIKRAKELCVPFKELTLKYEADFIADLQSLNVILPNQLVRVTDNIPIIIRFIENLLKSNKAYVGGDGSVYFDVGEYSYYGKLHKITTQDSLENDADASYSKYKKSPFDFALWKVGKDEEVKWDAPFGAGRPGWHIECSAIAGNTLGDSIDIHAGGIDLCFPHHENEEAQSCAHYSKQQWVNYWIHTGHLIIKSGKMSKSLKNTVSIADLLKTCSANVFRMSCLMSSYRNNMDYNENMLKVAENNLNNFVNFINNFNNYMNGRIQADLNNELIITNLNEARKNIDESLANDFNTANVIKILNNLVNCINKMFQGGTSNVVGLDNSVGLIATINLITKTLDMFGVDLLHQNDRSKENNAATTNNKDLIDILVKFRHDVRLSGVKNKNKTILQLCDGVRSDVNKCGVVITDHKKESSWSSQ